jgi:hypothetical protein
MGKVKTSHKRKKFSANTPNLRLKKGVKLAKHDPFKDLLDGKIIAQAFWECLKENDPAFLNQPLSPKGESLYLQFQSLDNVLLSSWDCIILPHVFFFPTND